MAKVKGKMKNIILDMYSKTTAAIKIVHVSLISYVDFRQGCVLSQLLSGILLTSLKINYRSIAGEVFSLMQTLYTRYYHNMQVICSCFLLLLLVCKTR